MLDDVLLLDGMLEVDVEPEAVAVVVPATLIWLELSVLVRVCPLNWKFPASNVPVSITLSCILAALSILSIILKCPVLST